MKTNVFFKWIAVFFTFLSLATAQEVNEYGMLPCPNGESVCPPKSDGSVQGMLKKLDKAVGMSEDVFYQTNLIDIGGGGFSGFKKTPSYTDLVFGDYTVAGNSVLKFEYVSGWSMDHYPSKYEKQGDSNIFKINSSKSTLYLPASVKPENIKYARATWTGSIHNNKAFQDTGGTKNIFGFKCDQAKDVTILKEHKKPLSPEWLIDMCSKNTEGKNVDCGAIPTMIVDGVYKPEFKYEGYTDKKNIWHSYEPYKNFNLNEYSDPGNYMEYVETGQKPQQEKPKPFFTCTKPDVMPVVKISDLRPIDIVNSCKRTLDSNKYDCDNVLGADQEYYTHVNYEQNSNSDITMDATNKKTIKLKPEDVKSRKIDLVAECKKTFHNDARCDKFKDINYYKPYSKDELDIVTDQVLKIDIKVKSSNDIDPDVKTFWEVGKETYTLDLVKEDCRKTKKNQNENYKASECDDITEEHAKDLIGKPRLAGGNNPKYKAMASLFGGFECKNHKLGECEFACENNAKGRENVKCPKTKKVYRFAGMEYSKSTETGDYCSVYPEKCVDVETADIGFRGATNIDDFCKANPGECKYNVKTCRELKFGTDNSSYCAKNPDKCTKAKMCTNYSWVTGEKKNPDRIIGNENNIAEMTRKHLKGYDEMTLKLGDSYQNVKALDDDIYYTFSTNTVSGDGAGAVWFMYSANADVTEFVKNALSNYSGGSKANGIWEIPITGGDVKTSDGYVVNYWDDGWRPYKATFWDLGGTFGTGVVRTSFGSWILTIVYSDENSYKALSTNKERMKSPFKPKNVTIYNGFAGLVDDLHKPSPDGVRLNFDLTGFFTPLQDKYDAKATVYASANANYYNPGDSFKISNMGDNNNLVSIRNEITKNNRFSGGISIVKPNATEVSVIDYEKRRAISINTYILNTREKQLHMKAGQDSIHLQYGVKAYGNSSEQTFPSMFAFSTDLYVPDVCYYNTVYNSAGKSSRGGGFVVREGETVKNQVYFAIAKNSESDEAHGLKVKAQLSDNIQYVNDTMRIDNSLEEKGANDFIDSKLKYMKDNEKGLYEDEKYTNLIPEFKDRQFNKYDGKYLSFFIGKDAGYINGNTISGGSLYKNNDNKVYIEYKTRVGGYYEEPTFRYDFALKGNNMPYNLPMLKCPSPSGKTEWENIVEVVPLDGVKVVNEDYKKRGDYDGLYTQIANKPFNVKVSYDVNITGTSDDDLSRLLSDKEICKLLGYGSKCESENFIKEKVGEFNKKRKELSDEINRLNSEILKINNEISKKESQKILAQNELAKAEANLLEAEQRVKEAQERYDKAQKGLEKNNAEKDLKAAKKARDDIKGIRDRAKIKLDGIEDEITKLKVDLEKAKGDKSKNEADLGKKESPISDEMSSRIGRLNGVFETTLVSLDDIDRSKCKEAKDNKDLHFNYYQDFTIGQRNFKKDKVDANGQDIKDIMCINEGKFDNFKCDYSDAKKEENKPVKVSQMSKAFPSYQYFTNFDINDKLIDMDNVTIGFARKDYTFIVSYLPSGAERLASCNQECVSRYATEPGAQKQEKINKCQKVCGKKYTAGEIDEKYLEEFRMDVCASDTFAVRPAYFAYDKSKIKDIYTAGDSKTLHDSFKDSVYPSDENGNYVLGYDNVLNPADRNSTGVRSTILSAIVPDSCKINEVNNIIRYDEKIIYQDEEPTNSSILWDKEFDSSNNLLASFEFDKDNKDKNDTERKKYNAITSKNSLEGFKSNSEDLKSYADISLNDLGKLNYYNIGYAKLRLTDHDWTASDKLYTDKTAQSYNYSLEGKDSLGNELNLFGEYIGFKERDKDTSKLKSMIGEYVATKHNIIDQDIILKFKHGKVMVSVLGIRDAIAKTDPFDSNKSKLYTYTFFNSDSEEMGASLDMNVTASLTNADICIKGECNEKGDKGTYQKIEIYPTLYHNGCYARDVEFGLDFAFDCNKTASDERCKPTVKNRGEKFSCSEYTFHSSCYKPIEGSSKTGKLKQGLIYSVTGLAKDNNTTTINDKVQAQEKDEDGNKKTVNKPGEIEILIEEQGFKNASYKIPLNFNFIRFAGTNNTLDPKLIYADDFIRSKNVPFEEKDLPTDNKIDSKNVSTKDIKANIVSFKKFNNEISELVGDKTIRRDGNKEKNNGEFPSLDDKSLAIDPSSKATFYYGYINANEREYKLEIEENQKEVRVHSMFYYDGEKDDGDKKDKLTDFARKNLPVLYLEKNASANLVNPKEKFGFYTNKFEYYTNENDIKSDKFVRSYTNPNVTGVGNRSAMKDTDNMYEQLSLGVEPDSTETVQVNVKPWFVFSDTDPGYNNSYNTFIIKRESDNLDEVGQDGNWGGTGKVKDGDIVGRYLDNNGSASKGRLKNRDRLENAISW